MVLRRGEQFPQHPNEWSDNSWSEVIQKDPSGAAEKYETASMLPLHGIVGAFPIMKNTSVFCSQRDTAKTQSVHLVSLPRPLSFPMAIPKLIGVKNAYSCGSLFPKHEKLHSGCCCIIEFLYKTTLCKEGARTPGLQVWSYQIKMLTEKLGVFEAKDQNPWVPSTSLSQAVLENATFAAFSPRAYLWRSIRRSLEAK